jgi:hypothetical protein
MIPILAISIAAGLGLASQQKPTYTAFGSYALVYQGTITELRDPRDSNPLGANGALLLGEALAADLMSGPSQLVLGGVGNSGVEPGEADEGTAYSISRPDDSESYLVQTWSKDADSARATIDAVLAAAPAKAIAIQDRVGAPKRSQFTAFVTLPPQIVQLPPTSTLKLVIAMSGVGVLAGAALALIVDRLIVSRRARRTARPPRVIAWDDPIPVAPPGGVEPAVPFQTTALAQSPDIATQPALRTEDPHVERAASVGDSDRAVVVNHAGQGSRDEPGHNHQPGPVKLVDEYLDPMERLRHERFWEQEVPVLHPNGAETHANGEHVSESHPTNKESERASGSFREIEADRAPAGQ